VPAKAGHSVLCFWALKFIKVKAKQLLAMTVQLSLPAAVPCPELLKMIF
jgi:hypothetical protein